MGEAGVLGKVVAPRLFPTALLAAAGAAVCEQDAIAVFLIRRVAMHDDEKLLGTGRQPATGRAVEDVKMPVVAHRLHVVAPYDRTIVGRYEQRRAVRLGAPPRGHSQLNMAAIREIADCGDRIEIDADRVA